MPKKAAKKFALERTMKNLVKKRLPSRRPTSTVRISAYCTFMASLGREDIKVTKPIPVTIEPDDGGYIASFMDANIASRGETVQEAFECLQDLLASSFVIGEQRKESELGPRLLREKRILMEFLCRSTPDSLTGKD